MTPKRLADVAQALFVSLKRNKFMGAVLNVEHLSTRSLGEGWFRVDRFY